MADGKTVFQATGAKTGYAGPINLGLPVYFDHATRLLSDFVCGANENGKHHVGVNFGRDLPTPETVDIRNVVSGDPTPGGNGTLRIARGIEVGHIFQLGTQYSEAMNATVQDAQGNDAVMTMGCYGVGITRIVGAAIEQNHDERGNYLAATAYAVRRRLGADKHASIGSLAVSGRSSVRRTHRRGVRCTIR